MAYFVMDCEGKHPVMPLARGPLGYGDNWMGGTPVSDPPRQPLVYELNPRYPGTPKPMYGSEAVPIMRGDVIAALASAGVDNIDYYDAVLRDPSTGKEYTNYKAFNIIGLVACADMGSSERMPGSTSDIGDVDFHALVIDEKKARGLLLFRLAESVNAIVVHEKVKDRIEAAGIPGFYFYGPGEWSG